MATAEQDAPSSADDEALAAIYREQFEFVWRSLAGLGFAAAEAEDLAQDVFLVVRRKLADFDWERPVRPWLFGIVRRIAADHRRSAARTERRLRLLSDSADSAARPNPEQDTARSEAAQFIERFLATLDEPRRMAFILAEIEGLSGTEIAEALGVNRNTVYTRLRAARQLFEAAIREEQP